MFLTELLEVLEVCEVGKLESGIVTRLFKRLIKCISGAQLQVIFILKFAIVSTIINGDILKINEFTVIGC